MESRAYGYLPRDRRAVDRLDATIPEATIRDPGPTTEHQEDTSTTIPGLKIGLYPI